MAERFYYKKGSGSELRVRARRTPITQNANGWTEITESKYRELSQKLAQIHTLKHELSKTDYQALKYAEGWISESDYAPIKAERQSKRDQINELEGGLK